MDLTLENLCSITIIISAVYGIYQHRVSLRGQRAIKSMNTAAEIYSDIYQLNKLMLIVTEGNGISWCNLKQSSLSEYIQKKYNEIENYSRLDNQTYCVPEDLWAYSCRDAFEITVRKNQGLLTSLLCKIPKAKYWLNERIATMIEKLLKEWESIDQTHLWLCHETAENYDLLPENFSKEKSLFFLYSKESKVKREGQVQELIEALNLFSPGHKTYVIFFRDLASSLSFWQKP